jgi:hypothetical protein
MDLFRFVFACACASIITFISVIIVGIIFSMVGLSLNSLAEYLLQFLIIYFVMSKFGIKKGLKNKYSDFPKIN